MRAFFVLQKTNSLYDDQIGKCYEYKTSLPNGKQIQEGDWLIFSLTKKQSKLGKRILAIGQVETIDYRTMNGDIFASAYYSRFKSFSPPLTYEMIGGDPRKNKQHSMNLIDESVADKIISILRNHSL